MSQNRDGPDRPGSDQLHPFVYLAIIGLALWFVLSVWGFASDGYTDYLLVVVSGFVVIAVAIPLVLSRIGRKRPNKLEEKTKSLSDWAAGEFDTWRNGARGRTRGTRIFFR